MSEVASKDGWRSYRFDEMAVMVNDRIDDPSEAGVEYYVGLEHLDSESLTIRRWGSPSDVEATKLRFRVGDIIFGRRRVYQRKLAVAHFDGICSAHAMVLRAKPGVVLSEFLPFFMQSDLFMERAKEISVGSLSPTINWKTLANEKFILPPLEEQSRLLSLLMSLERVRMSLVFLADSQNVLLESLFQSMCSRDHRRKEGAIADFCELVTDGDHNPPDRVQKGIPHLVVANLRDGRIDETGCTYITEANFERVSRRYSPQGGDVLLSCVGSIGLAALVPNDYVFSADRSLAIYRPITSELLPEFCMWLLRSKASQDYFNAVATGTAQQHLYLNDLRRHQVRVPNIQIQVGILQRMRKIEDQLLNARLRVAEVASLRAKALSMVEGAHLQ